MAATVAVNLGHYRCPKLRITSESNFCVFLDVFTGDGVCLSGRGIVLVMTLWRFIVEVPWECAGTASLNFI